MRLKLTVNTQQANRVLEKIVTRLENFRPVLTQFGEYTIARTKRNFKGQHDPDGNPWKPLKNKTLAEKIRNHKILKILQRDGDLLKSIHYEISPRKVSIGSNDIKSRIHQLGGKAGRGRKVDIPARPYLSGDENVMAGMAEDYLQEVNE